MTGLSGNQGSFQLERNGDIVELIAIGCWDERLAHEFLTQVKQLIAPLDGRTWATIVDVREWELGTPEFQEVITQGTEEQVSLGLRREAYVIDESQVKMFQIDAMMPQGDAYYARYFKTYIDAFAWLNQEGFGNI
ncbi:hypothetical protein [Alteromonas facilis]|uniref:hypothetical protein n=1 Tax=Alteromonas facilis TaxID=2048004 RepID=UPI000C2932F5|nr:hypothetical protein [Alteromonas facilis]